MIRFFKVFLGSILTLIAAFIVFLLWSTFNDYQPAPFEKMTVQYTDDLKQDTLTAVIWNIGYAGLGDDMDFFYDGGKSMRSTPERSKMNLTNIIATLQKKPLPDLILLQEVDVNSKRSFNVNQQKVIKKAFDSYQWFFAYNYLVEFVPVPLGNPLGKVESGIMTGSKYKPAIVKRYSFEGNYSWPKSLFMLDRCFLSTAFPLPGGDTLFIVNTHNTAYDDGNIRQKQMQQLKEWIEGKKPEHNEFIIGGDWNQTPPDVAINEFGLYPTSSNYAPKSIPKDFLPENWQFVYDKNTPTNRGLDTIYHNQSYRTIIDFFIVSPGIEPIEVKTQKLNFTHSDHQPVYLKFRMVRQNEVAK